MKKHWMKGLGILAAVLMVTGLMAGSSVYAADTEEKTLEEMLILALEDEHHAYAEYEAIIAAYGTDTQFSNIIEAEATHIAAIEYLFVTYNYQIPIEDWASQVVLPESLEDAYETGVTAEIANIAMYESFLSQDLPADVVAVFTNLMNASKQHLEAFETGTDCDGTCDYGNDSSGRRSYGNSEDGNSYKESRSGRNSGRMGSSGRGRSDVTSNRTGSCYTDNAGFGSGSGICDGTGIGSQECDGSCLLP